MASEISDRALWLDYAGVITTDYSEAGYPAELAKKFGISTEAFVNTNRENQAMARLCIGELTEIEVSQLVVEHNSEATPILPQDFVTVHYEPDPEILSKIGQAKDSGEVRLSLVSNIFPASVDYLNARNIGLYFDDLFLSCEMGDKKPNHSFFNRIMEECGLNPEQVRFLDDTESNVVAAAELGIDADLIIDRDQVIKILNELPGVT